MRRPVRPHPEQDAPRELSTSAATPAAAPLPGNVEYDVRCHNDEYGLSHYLGRPKLECDVDAVHFAHTLDEAGFRCSPHTAYYRYVTEWTTL